MRLQKLSLFAVSALVLMGSTMGLPTGPEATGPANMAVGPSSATIGSANVRPDQAVNYLSSSGNHPASPAVKSKIPLCLYTTSYMELLNNLLK